MFVADPPIPQHGGHGGGTDSDAIRSAQTAVQARAGRERNRALDSYLHPVGLSVPPPCPLCSPCCIRRQSIVETNMDTRIRLYQEGDRERLKEITVAAFTQQASIDRRIE